MVRDKPHCIWMIGLSGSGKSTIAEEYAKKYDAKIISADNAAFLQSSELNSVASAVRMYSKNLQTDLTNGVVDVLNKLSSSDMSAMSQHYDLSQLTYEGQLILSNDTTRGLIDTYNNFLGINIGDSPSYMVSQAWNAEGGIKWLAIIVAFIIPILSAVTQWINTKLMPQAADTSSGKNDQQNSMAQSMKMMNTMMPVMSAFFCYTLPAGMGLYWIAGSVVRSIQQIVINKHIDKMDIDALVKKNESKRIEKLKKAGIDPKTVNKNATLNTKNVNNAPKKKTMSEKAGVKPLTKTEKDEALNNNIGEYAKNAKPGSLAAKANMVKEYNEKNNK